MKTTQQFRHFTISKSMAKPKSKPKPKPFTKISPLFFLLLLCLWQPQPTTAFSYSQLRTLFSLAHSLSTRVANLRASRGDLAGAQRARLIADKLDRGLGLGFWTAAFSMGWDYLKNYAWRDAVSFRETFSIAAEFNELLSSLAELSRLRSDSERAVWVSRNYRHILRVSKSVFNRLLSVFTKSGPLREMVEILKIEMEGDFLKDCLEVGTNDLKGMVQILKDLFASQYSNVGREEL